MPDSRRRGASQEEETMGKHHDKVKAGLAGRIAATPNLRGFRKPGSMNKKKSGYGRK